MEEFQEVGMNGDRNSREGGDPPGIARLDVSSPDRSQGVGKADQGAKGDGKTNGRADLIADPFMGRGKC